LRRITTNEHQRRRFRQLRFSRFWENPRRRGPARCATWFGICRTSDWTEHPGLPGWSHQTTSVPGTAAHQAQCPAGRHQV